MYSSFPIAIYGTTETGAQVVRLSAAAFPRVESIRIDVPAISGTLPDGRTAATGEAAWYTTDGVSYTALTAAEKAALAPVSYDEAATAALLTAVMTLLPPAAITRAFSIVSSMSAATPVVGTRANDGSALAAGSTHLTVGGSDGFGLRPIAIDTAGRQQVIASDISASGIITTQNLNGSTGEATAGSWVGFTSLLGCSTLSLQVTGTYTGVLVAQVTINGADWVSLGGTPLLNVGSGVYVATITSGVTGALKVDVTGFAGFRLVATTAVTGTANVAMRASQASTMMAVANALPAGTNPIGTVTANIGTGSLAAGNNLVGDVSIQVRAGNTGSASVANVNSPATPAAQSIKGTAGKIVGGVLTNTAAAPRYVKFFANASVTLGTTAAAFEIAVPANASVAISAPAGLGFTSGIQIAVTAARGLTDNTSITAGDVTGVIAFA